MIAQESLLIRIDDGHERHLGQVQSLAQQVHTHQHIIGALSQFGQDLHTVQR